MHLFYGSKGTTILLQEIRAICKQVDADECSLVLFWKKGNINAIVLKILNKTTLIVF